VGSFVNLAVHLAANLTDLYSRPKFGRTVPYAMHESVVARLSCCTPTRLPYSGGFDFGRRPARLPDGPFPGFS
jgi:hypothetical protein